jgi:tRNA U55 pseudouridine synthase TruB
MNDKSNKRGGMYWKEDKSYLSVTEILKTIDKPALRWWFGHEIYLAMVKNPSMNEAEAMASPYRINETAKNRGTAVHDIVEAYKNIDEVVGLEGPYKGYAQAFKNWLKDFDVKVQENEKTVISDKHGYAGTLDMLAVLNGDTLPTLIDVKTGKDLYPEVHLQTSAYKQALSEQGIKVQGCSHLLLMEDGTYKYEQGKDRLEAFLACKKLYEGLNAEKLEKIGYKI